MRGSCSREEACAVISDREWAKLLRIGTRAGRRDEGESAVPEGESECCGRRALLCAALGEYDLTPTERATAVRVALGESNQLIAQCRDVSVNTVKAQVRAIYDAAEVAGRFEFGADVLKRVLRLAHEE